MIKNILIIFTLGLSLNGCIIPSHDSTTESGHKIWVRVDSR